MILSPAHAIRARGVVGCFSWLFLGLYHNSDPFYHYGFKLFPLWCYCERQNNILRPQDSTGNSVRYRPPSPVQCCRGPLDPQPREPPAPRRWYVGGRVACGQPRCRLRARSDPHVRRPPGMAKRSSGHLQSCTVSLQVLRNGSRGPWRNGCFRVGAGKTQAWGGSQDQEVRRSSENHRTQSMSKGHRCQPERAPSGQSWPQNA